MGGSDGQRMIAEGLWKGPAGRPCYGQEKRRRGKRAYGPVCQSATLTTGPNRTLKKRRPQQYNTHHLRNRQDTPTKTAHPPASCQQPPYLGADVRVEPRVEVGRDPAEARAAELVGEQESLHVGVVEAEGAPADGLHRRDLGGELHRIAARVLAGGSREAEGQLGPGWGGVVLVNNGRSCSCNKGCERRLPTTTSV